jgi:hypothetical protein
LSRSNLFREGALLGSPLREMQTNSLRAPTRKSLALRTAPFVSAAQGNHLLIRDRPPHLPMAGKRKAVRRTLTHSHKNPYSFVSCEEFPMFAKKMLLLRT